MRQSIHIRKISRYQVLLAVILSFVFGTSVKAQDRKIKLAVVGLSNPSTLQKSNIGNALVDILDSEISTVGKYTLLERAELEELKKELNLGESGLGNAKTFAQKGGLTGADFLLLGKVSDYTYKENVSRKTQFVPGVGIREVLFYDHVGEVRVDIRLVDVRTGEDVRSVSGQGTSHVTGSVSFQNEWNYYLSTDGQGTLANLRSLLTDASQSAIRDAVRKLNDMEPDLASVRANRSISSELSNIGGGKILAALGQGQFVIGVPSTAGLKVGDRFHVIAEVPLKNAQGVVVYQEKREVGVLQITNISESDRALARLVNSTGTPGGGTGPAQDDALVFDQAYGKSLRGMAVPVSANSASSNGAQSGAATTEIATYVSRGDRFMNQQDYSEALEQYKQALRLQPNSAELLLKKVFAELHVGDLSDAEGDAEEAINAGGAIGILSYHPHFMGYSSGNLIIAKGKLAYQPRAGNDGFSVSSKAQVALSESTYMRTAVPDVIISWRGQDGKGHKYDMVFPMFLTAVPGTLGFPYHADGDAADKTTRLDGLVIRVINASLP